MANGLDPAPVGGPMWSLIVADDVGDEVRERVLNFLNIFSDATVWSATSAIVSAGRAVPGRCL